MTAGAEHRRGDPPTRLRITAVLIGAVLVTGAACTGAESIPATTAMMAAIPPSDEQAIRTAMGALNTTAGGAVAQQQTALRGVADPAGIAALDNCPPATSTLRFEPVWGGLRPDPAADADPDGTRYALPTLIRVYTGDRITGTDLTTLQLTVRAGAAYITPFCVG